MLSVVLDLLGALVRRPWVRWIVQNWKVPLYIWGGLSLLVLAFLVITAFNVSPKQAYSGYQFYSQGGYGQSGGFLSLLFEGVRGEGGFLGVVFSLVGLGIISVVAPLALVIVPAIIVSIPFLIFAGAVWLLVFVLGGLGLVSASPFILATGGRALFIYLAARWLASTDAREKKEAAVMAALGIGEASLRSIDGKARLMDCEEFNALQQRPQRGAPVRLGKVCGQWFDFANEKHVLVNASTRGGKGTTLIIPNLLRYPGSVFVLDPKGENAQLTHEARRAFGPVQALDPFGVSGLPSARFNPLATLSGPMMVTDAQMMADALIEGKDDHWNSSARGLLTGLLLHVATFPGFSARDLPTVRALLMSNLNETLEAMTKNTSAPQEVRDVGAWGMGVAENEWSSIVSTVVEQTKWLASPQIADCLRSGGEQVDFARYRNSVQSIFVCLPAPYFKTFSKWLRLVVATSLDVLTKQLNPDMPSPTRFVLDELAQLGTLEKVESALTLSAGYGVQLWGIWQHMGDIRRCYPNSGIAGWVSSSGIRLIFATQDNESVRYFEGMCGGALSETDIRHMAPHQMLCLLDGQNPVLVERVAYFEGQQEKPQAAKAGPSTRPREAAREKPQEEKPRESQQEKPRDTPRAPPASPPPSGAGAPPSGSPTAGAPAGGFSIPKTLADYGGSRAKNDHWSPGSGRK